MKQDTRLAFIMLMPTVVIVLSIVLFPLFVNIWISFKRVTLANLRPPQVLVAERLRGDLAEAGAEAVLQYRLRNTSQEHPVREVVLTDKLPEGLELLALDERCSLTGRALRCELGDWQAKQRETLKLPVRATAVYIAAGAAPRDTRAVMTGLAENTLTSFKFTLENYVKVLGSRDFSDRLRVTFFYTFFGTAGALILGLFAAQLLNVPFRGRALFRGLLLFPYISPVIAVAFTWIFFLDPFSGMLNALLQHYELIAVPINFLGVKNLPFNLFGMRIPFPLALVTVTAFEAWRYFPLAFLFILARMQAISSDIYEAAEVDGATPLQQFVYISLPQLSGIISVLFLLRFVWTFNKFDDIFLMTGGASGTTTLTVDVYLQAFALSDLGAGAAMAVVIFILLAIFVAVHIKVAGRDESF